MIYGDTWKGAWGGGVLSVTLKQSGLLSVCLFSVLKRLPNALFLLASLPLLFPMGQHNFVFPNL